MTWDFSIYPELTPSQKDIIREIGLTFLALQGAEHVIQFTVSFIFSDDGATTWEAILAMESSDRKKTLGQLVATLHKRAEIKPDFKERMDAFVQKRNRFIHSLFNEPEFLLDTEESVSKAHAFLMDFQEDIWELQNIFMAYNILLAKILGIEHSIMKNQPEHGRKHIEQTWRHFTKAIDFKRK